MTADDNRLEDAFKAARTGELIPSEDLMNRIMLDADRVLAEAIPAPAQQRPRLGRVLLEAIGGWPSFGGLAAATVAGIWIGVAAPAALGDLSAGLWGDTVEIPVLDTGIFAALEG